MSMQSVTWLSPLQLVLLLRDVHELALEAEHVFLELHLGGAQRRSQTWGAPRQQVWRVFELVEHLLEVSCSRQGANV